MTTKFTPGPWRIAGKGTIRAGDGWIGDTHWRNREANARLIAAAPDLYEAVRLLLADFADYPASERPCHAFDVARDALAKAEGRS
jgi:hypothetical protein